MQVKIKGRQFKMRRLNLIFSKVSALLVSTLLLPLNTSTPAITTNTTPLMLLIR